MTKYVCKTCGTEKEAEEAPTCDQCGKLMEESGDSDMDEDENMEDAEEEDLEE